MPWLWCEDSTVRARVIIEADSRDDLEMAVAACLAQLREGYTRGESPRWRMEERSVL